MSELENNIPQEETIVADNQTTNVEVEPTIIVEPQAEVVETNQQVEVETTVESVQKPVEVETIKVENETINKVEPVNQVQPVKKQNINGITPPATVLTRMHLDHTGRILSNIGILFTILTLALLLSPLLYMGYFLLLVVASFFVIVFSLGLVFLSENSPLAAMWATLDSVTNIAEYITILLPIFAGIAGVCSIVSLILMLFAKRKCTWRIAVSIMTIAIPVIAVIILVLGVLA